MGLRYPPFCFTEQGVAMLSSILGSETAVAVNIQIIRVFIKIRQVMMDHKEVLLHLERIEKRISKSDKEIKIIVDHLRMLLQPPPSPRSRIGFKRKNEI